MPFVIIADSVGEIINRHVGYNPGDEKELEKEILNLLKTTENKSDTLQAVQEISNPKNSREIRITESRVTPGKILPPKGGVRIVLSFTINKFADPTSSIDSSSRAFK